LNVSKSCYIIFNSGKFDRFNILFESTFLAGKDEVDFLGLSIDSRLKWLANVNCIISKITKLMRLVLRLRYTVNMNMLWMIYKAFVVPYLTQNIIIWGHCNRSLFDRLIVIQNRIVRIIENNIYLHNTEILDILHTNKLLSVNEYYEFSLGLYGYNHLYNLKHVFNFRRVNFVHDTRKASNWSIRTSRTNIGLNSIHNNVIRFFNKLPASLK
jgi:hypothetical protein